MSTIAIEHAQKTLPDLINDALLGKEIIIGRGGHPLVRLVPVVTSSPRPEFGSARGLISIPDDFDDPLPDFEEYER